MISIPVQAVAYQLNTVRTINNGSNLAQIGDRLILNGLREGYWRAIEAQLPKITQEENILPILGIFEAV